MYLTQAEYEAYSNSNAPSLYIRLEYRARKIVDALTFGRVRRMAAVPEAVKRLMVELIDLEESADAARKGEGVKSFSNDGYSENYETFDLTTIETAEHDTVTCYLLDEVDDNGTPLLYTGVDI